MSIQIKDYIDVAARARDLGCRVPVGIALLPGNFPTAANTGEFRYHPATPYIRSAWQTVHLEDESPTGTGVGDSGSGNVPLAVFFGAGLLASPAWRLTVALGMVSRVLALDPRCASPREVVFDVVVERPGGNGHDCIEYEGDAVGIVTLASNVRRIWSGNNMNREGTRV